MKCPIDEAVLQMTSRDGVEIDYCPTCRGVWLDRGELDKLIAKAEASTPSNEVAQNRRDKDDEGGFFGNLFDF